MLATKNNKMMQRVMMMTVLTIGLFSLEAVWKFGFLPTKDTRKH